MVPLPPVLVPPDGESLVVVESPAGGWSFDDAANAGSSVNQGVMHLMRILFGECRLQ